MRTQLKRVCHISRDLVAAMDQSSAATILRVNARGALPKGTKDRLDDQRAIGCDLQPLYPGIAHADERRIGSGMNQELLFNVPTIHDEPYVRSEERRVGKECRSRWSPYH